MTTAGRHPIHPRSSPRARRVLASSSRENRCEFMIRRALGVNSGQFTSRLGDADRTKCGEVQRRVALFTARSVGAVIDKPRIGADAIITKVTFSGKQRQNSPGWPAEASWPAGGGKKHAYCFQRCLDGSGAPGRAGAA